MMPKRPSFRCAYTLPNLNWIQLSNLTIPLRTWQVGLEDTHDCLGKWAEPEDMVYDWHESHNPPGKKKKNNKFFLQLATWRA